MRCTGCCAPAGGSSCSITSPPATIWCGAWQSLLERLTLRMTGEYQTRLPLPLPLVLAAGFAVEGAERLRARIVERVTAVKPAPGTGPSAAGQAR